MKSFLIGSRVKIALLALGWVVWFLVSDTTVSLASLMVSGQEGGVMLAQGFLPEDPQNLNPQQLPTPLAPTTPVTPQTPAPNPLNPLTPVTPGPVTPQGQRPLAQGVQLRNPLANIRSIPDLLAAILNVVIILAIPVIIFFIMLAGFKYVTARGNAAQVGEASKALLYAVIGGVLIIGATAIAQIIKNLVNAFAN